MEVKIEILVAIVAETMIYVLNLFPLPSFFTKFLTYILIFILALSLGNIGYILTEKRRGIIGIISVITFISILVFIINIPFVMLEAKMVKQLFERACLKLPKQCHGLDLSKAGSSIIDRWFSFEYFIILWLERFCVSLVGHMYSYYNKKYKILAL